MADEKTSAAAGAGSKTQPSTTAASTSKAPEPKVDKIAELESKLEQLTNKITELVNTPQNRPATDAGEADNRRSKIYSSAPLDEESTNKLSLEDAVSYYEKATETELPEGVEAISFAVRGPLNGEHYLFLGLSNGSKEVVNYEV